MTQWFHVADGTYCAAGHEPDTMLCAQLQEPVISGQDAARALPQVLAKLGRIRDLTELIGDRSGEPIPPRGGHPVRIAPSDRRVIDPLRRMLLAILDGP